MVKDQYTALWDTTTTGIIKFGLCKVTLLLLIFYIDTIGFVTRNQDQHIYHGM